MITMININSMITTSLSRVVDTALPSLSGSSVTYNAQKNIFLTEGYTSAAGNTYFQGIRASDRIAIKYNIGVGYLHTFLNGIEVTDKRLSCLLQLTNKYKNLVIRLIPVNSENLIPLDIQEKIGKTLISSRFTLSTYIRLFLAEILPTTIDKVLYLDSDVLCLGGVLPLYTANLDEIPLLGVEDIHSVKHTKRLNLSAYINAGVLLINLKYWRDKGVINNFYQHITDDRDLIKLHDQDVINLTFDNSIRMVSNVWNYQFMPIPQNKEITSVRLLHFIY